MSNAIINYLAVGATALVSLDLFLVLLHPRDLFLPLSSLARLPLPLAISLNLWFSRPTCPPQNLCSP